MKPILRIDLSSVECALARGDYAAVLSGLMETRSSVDLGSLSNNEKSRILYYKARALYNLGRFGSALVSIKSALRIARLVFDDELYASEKLTFGLIAAAMGMHVLAEEAYLESFVFRKRANNKAGLYGPLLNIGLLKILTGELEPAKSNCLKALELARKYNSVAEVALCRQAYFLALWLTGDSKIVLTAVSELRDLDTDDPNSRRIQSVVARCKMDRLDTQGCTSLLCEQLEFFKVRSMNRDVAVCLEYLGLNEYFAGNYKQARHYYDQVLAMPEPTASAVAQTLRMLTDVEVAEGHWDKAEATAQKAEAAILKISEKIELGALWRAYGQIHTHKQDHSKAREYFEKSIELLKALGARYELALSHLVAGQSASFSKEQQLEQLQAAKSLLIEMEVPKRIEQVDLLISKLAMAAPKRLTLKTSAKGPFIVLNAEMRRIVALADKVKDSDMTILITGESGTGKDMLAEYIHQTSNRKDQPCVAVNSANFQESLVEAELFGHAKGSFTSSMKDKPGLIETAHGGTFVFDEIGEIPINLQAKLLRVIETKLIRRIGENQDRPVDVRFIALTNRNLEAMATEKQFRSDLFYRINEIHLHLPPLRQRPEDLEAILSSLLTQENLAITGDELRKALKSINGYNWPGNVRQLQKLAKEVALADGQQSPVEALVACLERLPVNGTSPKPEVTVSRIREVLTENNNNFAQASRELGIPVSTLRYRLSKGN